MTFWNYWDGRNGEVMQELADRYSEENPGVTVENVFFGFGDLLPKLQAAVSGGEAPDVAAVDLVWMPQMAQSGRIARSRRARRTRRARSRRLLSESARCGHL